MAWLALLTVANAATLTVGTGQTYPTITAAVAAATAGDVVEVHGGIYTEDLTIGTALDLVAVGEVVVQATGSALQVINVTADTTITGLTIDGLGLARAIEIVASDLTLRDVTVVNGLARPAVPGFGSSGGAIKSQGLPRRLEIEGCRFENNLADVNGGAIYAPFGEVVITGTTFVGNDAGTGGAIAAVGLDRLELLGNTFHSNQADGLAGAVYVFLDDQATFTDHVVRGNRFCDNQADRGGALAIYHDLSVQQVGITIHDNLFQENAADRFGGALHLAQDVFVGVNGKPWQLQLLQNTFLGNHAGTVGGHVFAERKIKLSASNNVFAFATGGGAAIWQNSTLGRRDYNLFFSNTARDLGGSLTVANSGANTLFGVDPELVAYTPDGDCENDDTGPSPTSPLIDGGDPAVSDPDGSVSDIGWLSY